MKTQALFLTVVLAMAGSVGRAQEAKPVEQPKPTAEQPKTPEVKAKEISAAIEKQKAKFNAGKTAEAVKAARPWYDSSLAGGVEAGVEGVGEVFIGRRWVRQMKNSRNAKAALAGAELDVEKAQAEINRAKNIVEGTSEQIRGVEAKIGEIETTISDLIVEYVEGENHQRIEEGKAGDLAVEVSTIDFTSEENGPSNFEEGKMVRAEVVDGTLKVEYLFLDRWTEVFGDKISIDKLMNNGLVQIFQEMERVAEGAIDVSGEEFATAQEAVLGRINEAGGGSARFAKLKGELNGHYETKAIQESAVQAAEVAAVEPVNALDAARAARIAARLSGAQVLGNVVLGGLAVAMGIDIAVHLESLASTHDTGGLSIAGKKIFTGYGKSAGSNLKR